MLRQGSWEIIEICGTPEATGQGAGTSWGRGGRSHERVVLTGGAGSALGVKKSFWGQVGAGLEVLRMGRGGGNDPGVRG